MSKRIISVLIIASILVAVFPISHATAEPRASQYISSYYANLYSGDSSGELELSYYISTTASGITRLGIIAIFVYRSDGSIARVISGNASNGLLVTSGWHAEGTYTFTLDPGVSYYCKVRFIGENASGSDTPSYTTNTVVAPR